MLLPAFLSLVLAAAPQPSSDLARAQALLQSGQWSEARTLFEAVLQRNPSDPDAQQGEVKASEKLALEARSRHAMDEALAALLRARKFAPDQPRLLLDLGILEDQMRLFNDADDTLARLYRLQPGDPQTLYAVARVKLDLQQLEPAEKAMRAYLELRPEDATAHYGLGRILQMAQRSEDARQEFARSIELQPRQTESYFQLGQIALDSGQYSEALASFAKTLTGDPHHGGALAGSGIAYFRQKQYQQALDFLQRAVAAAPDYQPAHYYLGLTLAHLGRKDESASELATAAKMADAQNASESQRLRLESGP
jgi:tetratricopeptide (TPR) repeat protein